MARGKIIIINGAKQMLKTVKQEMKASLIETADHWHETMLKDHFKEGAARKYNYQRRSFKHIQRKRKRYGHNRPLEFSGKMKRDVLRSSRTTASKKKVTLRMTGPRYLFQVRKDYDQPHMADELTRITRREEQRLNQFLGDSLTNKIKKNKTRKVIRV